MASAKTLKYNRVQGATTKPLGALSEGSYHIARSPTVGTGLASIAALTTFTATSPFVIVTNGNDANGNNIYIDYIKLTCTVAGTNAADLQWATKLDTSARYSSGGSTLAGKCTNTGVSNLSSALVYAGALVASADGGGVRLLDNGNLRTTIMVAKDQIIWSFGGDQQDLDITAIATATATQRSLPHAPVAIAPGHSFLLYLWSTSQSAAQSHEVVVGYFER